MVEVLLMEPNYWLWIAKTKGFTLESWTNSSFRTNYDDDFDFRQARVRRDRRGVGREDLHGRGGQVHPDRASGEGQPAGDRVQVDVADARQRSGNGRGVAGKPHHRAAQRQAQRDPGQEGGRRQVQGQGFQLRGQDDHQVQPRRPVRPEVRIINYIIKFTL